MKTGQALTFTVIDCGSRKVPDIVRILRGAGGRVVTVPLTTANRASFSGTDAMIVSGGPALFTDPLTGRDLVEQFRFLDDVAVPVLGICLGHQALALRAGGTAFLGAPRREMETIEVLEEHALLEGLERPVVMRADHAEGIEAPAGYRVIARSAAYANEMMIAESRPRFGVQFHPEASGEPGKRLVENFLALVRGYR